MTNILGLVSFNEQDCLCCSLCYSRWSYRDTQGMQKAGSCSATASELELCELPAQLRLGRRQQDTWNLTKLAINCCMKAALSDHPKGPPSSASKRIQQQMPREEQKHEPAYLIDISPCLVTCSLGLSAINVASIHVSSSFFEPFKAFSTHDIPQRGVNNCIRCLFWISHLLISLIAPSTCVGKDNEQLFLVLTPPATQDLSSFPPDVSEK